MKKPAKSKDRKMAIDEMEKGLRPPADVLKPYPFQGHYPGFGRKDGGKRSKT
jgi:hypothetical protein